MKKTKNSEGDADRYGSLHEHLEPTQARHGVHVAQNVEDWCQSQGSASPSPCVFRHMRERFGYCVGFRTLIAFAHDSTAA
jgi:hypothetical protein